MNSFGSGFRQKRSKMTARQRLIKLQSLRDHSPLELKKKLIAKHEVDEVVDALQWAEDLKFMPTTPAELTLISERYAAVLARQGRGPNYINQKLKNRGLPLVKSDNQQETLKARDLLVKKFIRTLGLSLKDDRSAQGKAFRFLLGRGYSMSVARDALKLSKNEKD